MLLKNSGLLFHQEKWKVLSEPANRLFKMKIKCRLTNTRKPDIKCSNTELNSTLSTELVITTKISN